MQIEALQLQGPPMWVKLGYKKYLHFLSHKNVHNRRKRNDPPSCSAEAKRMLTLIHSMLPATNKFVDEVLKHSTDQKNSQEKNSKEKYNADTELENTFKTNFRYEPSTGINLEQ